MDLVQFPILSNLKHLELNAWASDDESLLCFCPLIEASPFLNKFVLEVSILFYIEYSSNYRSHLSTWLSSNLLFLNKFHTLSFRRLLLYQ